MSCDILWRWPTVCHGRLSKRLHACAPNWRQSSSTVSKLTCSWEQSTYISTHNGTWQATNSIDAFRCSPLHSWNASSRLKSPRSKEKFYIGALFSYSCLCVGTSTALIVQPAASTFERLYGRLSSASSRHFVCWRSPERFITVDRCYQLVTYKDVESGDRFVWSQTNMQQAVTSRSVTCMVSRTVTSPFEACCQKQNSVYEWNVLVTSLRRFKVRHGSRV